MRKQSEQGKELGVLLGVLLVEEGVELMEGLELQSMLRVKSVAEEEEEVLSQPQTR